MSREKQIEEMAKVICGSNKDCKTCVHHFEIKECGCLFYAKCIYNAGYRKQSEGEWKWIADDDVICSACGKVFFSADNADAGTSLWHFCPECGAKMKGGAE